MRPAASHCLACGAGYYPPRLRCHRCDGTAFESRPIEQARILAFTAVHRLPPGCIRPHLVELESTGGLRLLAVSSAAPVVGALASPVQLDDGAIVIDNP